MSAPNSSNHHHLFHQDSSTINCSSQHLYCCAADLQGISTVSSDLCSFPSSNTSHQVPSRAIPEISWWSYLEAIAFCSNFQYWRWFDYWLELELPNWFGLCFSFSSYSPNYKLVFMRRPLFGHQSVPSSYFTFFCWGCLSFLYLGCCCCSKWEP